ncbi:diguanylate cyclase domain-containing protein [Photobacterium nomapromontoriensis]|uniref:cache domain-containing protein n=1 Tax=Photobacterium nomapromontoriensis TaxID=2910237 RepID=UPI003D110AC7
MRKLPISEIKFFFFRFVAVFLVLVSIFVSIFSYDLLSEMELRKSNVKVQQKALLAGKKEYIEWVMGSIVKETVLLADLLSLQQIYQIESLPDTESKQRLQQQVGKMLQQVSQRKEIYDQIRYLDINGNEIVRINFKNGQAIVVPQEQLQNKSHRYYFTEALKLQCNKVYISPLDLNIEHGKLEIPYKPVIRLALAVYDKKGDKRGVVVINYLADYLVKGMNIFNLDSGTNYMMINRDGYYLFNNQYPDLEFAFMFKSKLSETIYSQFPALKETIQSTRSGQVETDHGIMTIESVGAASQSDPYCFQEFHIADNGATAWKLISYADYNKQLDFVALLSRHQTFMGLSILLSLVLAYFIARYQLWNYRDDKHINYLAHNDSLTGLINRVAFQNQAKNLLKANAKAGKAAGLIYIDLDDFKRINDAYGHAVGDQTLQQAAAAMKAVFGHNALLARLGGDEFAVLLHHPKQMENPEHYVRSLLQLLRQPMEIAPGVFHPINASIGGYIFTESEEDLNVLMNKADMAMYEAKRKGKNRYFFIYSECNAGEKKSKISIC